MAVWLHGVWCSRGVPDIDVKLPTEWFHISASCVIEQGACEISNTVKRRSHYDSQSKVVLFGAVWHASFMHPVSYASVLSPQYAGWYLWGRAVFPTIKQHMKQCAFSSLSHMHAYTHSFSCFLQTRPLLPLVTGKDVDVEALVKGFESSFIGGGSDKKSVILQRKCTLNISKWPLLHKRLVQTGCDRLRSDLSS